MKNQYFGDINDYKKYSLLRLLGGLGQIKTTVCWVLTEDDNRSDGSRIKYLEKPEQWRDYDQVVFEHLRENVLNKGMRDVSVIERGDILPNCTFYREFVHDDNESRDEYFRGFWDFSKGTDLIFFDPDNGLEVKSIPRGKRNSSKYVYWDEIELSYRSGHSLLIYQHFPRKPREQFIRSLIRRFKTLDDIRCVFSYCTFHVAFLLIPQHDHEEMFAENSRRIKDNWGNLIMVRTHTG